MDEGGEHRPRHGVRTLIQGGGPVFAGWSKSHLPLWDLVATFPALDWGR